MDKKIGDLLKNTKAQDEIDRELNFSPSQEFIKNINEVRNKKLGVINEFEEILAEVASDDTLHEFIGKISAQETKKAISDFFDKTSKTHIYKDKLPIINRELPKLEKFIDGQIKNKSTNNNKFFAKIKNIVKAFSKYISLKSKILTASGIKKEKYQNEIDEIGGTFREIYNNYSKNNKEELDNFKKFREHVTEVKKSTTQPVKLLSKPKAPKLLR